ncbi:endonuclease domain-containing 1 protein-like [Alosa sapidissima]|uniref:endonuclease domain-containing 1 protein-like n=1 Tax=Alosa sapidissima TaxID=34773 RepID=UPI001C08D00B|nr:endonuclease domain-containing 1 protein-like [Alosa sapidissima]
MLIWFFFSLHSFYPAIFFAMKCWLPLLPVLSTLLCLSQGDVGDFSPCLNFFYRYWPPSGLSGTPICQNYTNRYYFATLYSRERRSPWFSAYLYTTPAGKRPKGVWKYEPQLANSNASGVMLPFPIPPKKVDQTVVKSQAVQQDYINSSYTRGHLNPSLHHQNRSERRSTFTLTNVVPQKMDSNYGPWSELESNVNVTLNKYCAGPAYIVTGIIPYRMDRWLKDEHRVAIPEYLWSAYCCPTYSQNLPESLRRTFPTFAAIGRNDPNSTEEMVPVDRTKKKFVGYDVRPMPLTDLEIYLRERYGREIAVFSKQCL